MSNKKRFYFFSKKKNKTISHTIKDCANVAKEKGLVVVRFEEEKPWKHKWRHTICNNEFNALYETVKSDNFKCIGCYNAKWGIDIGREMIKDVIEKILDIKMNEIYPEFLVIKTVNKRTNVITERKGSVHGYNKSFKIGFMYKAPYYDSFDKDFHKTTKLFERTRNIFQEKINSFREHKAILIIVDYRLKKHELFDYCYKYISNHPLITHLLDEDRMNTIINGREKLKKLIDL